MLPDISGLFLDDFKAYHDAFLYDTDCHLEPLAYLAQNGSVERLRIRKQKLEDLNFLNQLPDLIHLDFKESKIQSGDMSHVSSSTNLQILNLSDTQISGKLSFRRMKQLETLDLSQNNLKEWPVFPDGLKWLDLSGNEWSDFQGLEHLSRLELLIFDQFQGSTLTGIQHLKALKSLQIDHGPVLFDIRALSGLRIQALSLANNAIRDISVLSSLSQLHYIDLNNNRIRNIDSLADLIHLNTLKLQHNFIVSAEAVRQLKDIQIVLLKANEIEELTDLSHLLKLQKITLRSNPFIHNTNTWKTSIRNLEKRNIDCDLYPDL